MVRSIFVAAVLIGIGLVASAVWRVPSNEPVHAPLRLADIYSPVVRFLPLLERNAHEADRLEAVLALEATSANRLRLNALLDEHRRAYSAAVLSGLLEDGRLDDRLRLQVGLLERIDRADEAHPCEAALGLEPLSPTMLESGSADLYDELIALEHTSITKARQEAPLFDGERADVLIAAIIPSPDVSNATLAPIDLCALAARNFRLALERVPADDRPGVVARLLGV